MTEILSHEKGNRGDDDPQPLGIAVIDLQTRRQAALTAVDTVSVGFSHIRAVIVAGTGFFTDAYDLFSANFITTMIGLAYYNNNTIPSHVDTAIKLSTTAGAHRGRSWPLLPGTIDILAGDYGDRYWGRLPLSSVITAEFATVKWRGALMNSVFAMQGFGNFAAALVSFICVVGFKESLIQAETAAQCDERCQVAADKMWRTIVAFGTVPALLALYFRLTIPETPHYTMDITLDIEQAQADVDAYLKGKRGGTAGEGHEVVAKTRQKVSGPKSTWKEFWMHFRHWRYGKILLGTAGSWFFIDIAFWGLGLNNSVILKAIGYASSTNVYQSLYNTVVGNLILAVAGNIPGYWVSVATIDILGRKPIQMASFIILTALFCVIGFAYHQLTSHALLALYVLCQFFSNFGANSTTFIVPGEVFPTRFRSTAHGISAGAGKIGATLAQAIFGPLENIGGPSAWLNRVMEIFALFMLCGVFTTFLIPETKRKSLEELAVIYHDDDSELVSNFERTSE